MNPQNQTIREISKQSKELIASISELALLNPQTTDGETLNAILANAKNRIEGAVENAKVAFRYYNEHSSDILHNDKTEPQV